MTVCSTTSKKHWVTDHCNMALATDQVKMRFAFKILENISCSFIKARAKLSKIYGFSLEFLVRT